MPRDRSRRPGAIALGVAAAAFAVAGVATLDHTSIPGSVAPITATVPDPTMPVPSQVVTTWAPLPTTGPSVKATRAKKIHIRCRGPLGRFIKC